MEGKYYLVKSGSDPNMTHYYGTHLCLDLDKEDECDVFDSFLEVKFPTKGGKSLDAAFVVDSLKLGLFFQAKYSKP